jgi:hypothetical protein
MEDNLFHRQIDELFKSLEDEEKEKKTNKEKTKDKTKNIQEMKNDIEEKGINKERIKLFIKRKIF